MATPKIEDVVSLDEAVIRAFLKRTNLAPLALALRGVSDPAKARILEVMDPPRVAALMEINYRLGPTDLSEKDALDVNAILRLSDRDLQTVMRQIETWDEIACALDGASPATRLALVRNSAKRQLAPFYDAVTAAIATPQEACHTAEDLLMQVVRRLDADGEIAFSGEQMIDQARQYVEWNLNEVVGEGKESIE